MPAAIIPAADQSTQRSAGTFPARFRLDGQVALVTRWWRTPRSIRTSGRSRASRTTCGTGSRAGTCLGRLGTPLDVAGLAVFLAWPASGYVTGQTLIVDGGASITYPIGQGKHRNLELTRA